MTQTYRPEYAPVADGAPYTTTWQTFGIVNVEDVRVAFMPRMRFLELVDDCIKWYADEYNAHGDAIALLPGLREVALEMLTFPLGRWIHEDRGCGCVVGEYLVAREIIRSRDRTEQIPVDDLIEMQYPGAPGHLLTEFGMRIDRLVKDDLRTHGVEFADPDQRVSAVVFIDALVAA